MSASLSLTRAESLAVQIEDRIRRDDLGPGESIGTMDELREQTGFARSTVSEAVRLLNDRGIIQIRPGRGGGLFVAQPNPVVRLRHTLLTVREKPTSVEDAIAVREALELLIDLDAARHRTRQDVADLRKLLTRLRRCGPDAGKFMRANWALHERIAAITPNHMASAVYLGTLHYVAASSTDFRTDHDQDDHFSRRLQIHVDLVNALAEGDETATGEAVRQHNA